MDTVREVRKLLESLQKSFQCIICLDLLSDPVSTKCNHQFCSSCLAELTSKSSKKKPPACPLCKTKITKRGINNDTALGGVVNAVRDVCNAADDDCQVLGTTPILSQRHRKHSREEPSAKKRKSLAFVDNTASSTVSKYENPKFNDETNHAKATSKIKQAYAAHSVVSDNDVFAFQPDESFKERLKSKQKQNKLASKQTKDNPTPNENQPVTRRNKNTKDLKEKRRSFTKSESTKSNNTTIEIPHKKEKVSNKLNTEKLTVLSSDSEVQASVSTDASITPILPNNNVSVAMPILNNNNNIPVTIPISNDTKIANSKSKKDKFSVLDDLLSANETIAEINEMQTDIDRSELIIEEERGNSKSFNKSSSVKRELLNKVNVSSNKKDGLKLSTLKNKISISSNHKKLDENDSIRREKVNQPETKTSIQNINTHKNSNLQNNSTNQNVSKIETDIIPEKAETNNVYHKSDKEKTINSIGVSNANNIIILADQNKTLIPKQNKAETNVQNNSKSSQADEKLLLSQNLHRTIASSQTKCRKRKSILSLIHQIESPNKDLTLFGNPSFSKIDLPQQKERLHSIQNSIEIAADSKLNNNPLKKVSIDNKILSKKENSRVETEKIISYSVSSNNTTQDSTSQLNLRRKKKRRKKSSATSKNDNENQNVDNEIEKNKNNLENQNVYHEIVEKEISSNTSNIEDIEKLKKLKDQAGTLTIETVDKVQVTSAKPLPTARRSNLDNTIEATNLKKPKLNHQNSEEIIPATPPCNKQSNKTLATSYNNTLINNKKVTNRARTLSYTKPSTTSSLLKVKSLNDITGAVDDNQDDGQASLPMSSFPHKTVTYSDNDKPKEIAACFDSDETLDYEGEMQINEFNCDTKNDNKNDFQKNNNKTHCNDDGDGTTVLYNNNKDNVTTTDTDDVSKNIETNEMDCEGGFSESIILSSSRNKDNIATNHSLDDQTVTCEQSSCHEETTMSAQQNESILLEDNDGVILEHCKEKLCDEEQGVLFEHSFGESDKCLDLCEVQSECKQSNENEDELETCNLEEYNNNEQEEDYGGFSESIVGTFKERSRVSSSDLLASCDDDDVEEIMCMNNSTGTNKNEIICMNNSTLTNGSEKYENKSKSKNNENIDSVVSYENEFLNDGDFIDNNLTNENVNDNTHVSLTEKVPFKTTEQKSKEFRKNLKILLQNVPPSQDKEVNSQKEKNNIDFNVSMDILTPEPNNVIVNHDNVTDSIVSHSVNDDTVSNNVTKDVVNSDMLKDIADVEVINVEERSSAIELKFTRRSSISTKRKSPQLNLSYSNVTKKVKLDQSDVIDKVDEDEKIDVDQSTDDETNVSPKKQKINKSHGEKNKLSEKREKRKREQAKLAEQIQKFVNDLTCEDSEDSLSEDEKLLMKNVFALKGKIENKKRKISEPQVSTKDNKANKVIEIEETKIDETNVSEVSPKGKPTENLLIAALSPVEQYVERFSSLRSTELITIDSPKLSTTNKTNVPISITPLKSDKELNNAGDAELRVKNVTPRNKNTTPRNENVTPRNENVTPRNGNVTPRNGNVTPRNENVTPRNVTPTLISSGDTRELSPTTPSKLNPIPVNQSTVMGTKDVFKIPKFIQPLQTLFKPKNSSSTLSKKLLPNNTKDQDNNNISSEKDFRKSTEEPNFKSPDSSNNLPQNKNNIHNSLQTDKVAKSTVLVKSVQSPHVQSPHTTTDPQGEKKMFEVKKDTLPVVMTSRLTKKHMQYCHMILKKLGGRYVQQMISDVTHLLVTTDENGCLAKDTYTYKYLIALVSGLWIVDFKWMVDSVKQGKYVQPDKYEAKGDPTSSHEQIPKQYRQAKESHLFNGYRVCLLGKFQQSQIGKDQLATLIGKTGGEVSFSLDEIHCSSSQIQTVLLSDDLNQLTYNQKNTILRQSLHCIHPEWVVESIINFKIQDSNPYELKFT